MPAKKLKSHSTIPTLVKMPPPAEEKPAALLTSTTRLRKIDLLRDKNIGKYLPLPQLVAVGDQSSGKSSLLESLTGIPFPRGQELCTRYATQITHRREGYSFINVSIIPGPGASESERANLERYQKSVSTTSELHEQLPAILEEVNELMGIRTSQNPEGTKTFTDDVLKIEKCGPNEDYLTVIDVPGIFRITTDNVTTEADKIMVRNMVQNYIRDDQTIILAVLPCNVDIVTQGILAMAEKYDPTGHRTLGILTKPDLVRERSAQRVVCGLVKGEKRPLNLGYHLARSRGADDEGGAFGDDARDILFKEEPWCTLPSDRLGVVALRQRLQQLLGDLTDKAFPKLRSEIRELLKTARKDLDGLGQSRQTVQEQQQFLVNISGEFQSLVRAAVSADYSSHVFEDDKFRLITTVMNLTDKFKANFMSSAHTYKFVSSGAENKPEISGFAEEEEEEDSMDRFPDLDSIIMRELDDVAPREGIMEWIKSVHRRSRGTELTSLNKAVISTVIKQQTSKWMARAEYYVSKVIYMIHDFIVSGLEVVCSNGKIRDELLAQILDSTLARYEAGLSQARHLVRVERDGHPYTFNGLLRTKLAALQTARWDHDLRVKMEKNVSVCDDEGREILVSSVGAVEAARATLQDKDSGKAVAEDVHDLLKSYYEVARERFIDNVYLQAVTDSLITGENSPLGLFSEKWVLELEPDRLEAIAGESFQTSEQRTRLKQRIQDLTEAVDILRR